MLLLNELFKFCKNDCRWSFITILKNDDGLDTCNPVILLTQPASSV